MAQGKPKDGSKNPGGRPKAIIDYDLVLKLASIMCTQEEIAAHIDIDVRTLLRDEMFCQTYKKGIENGRMSLRRHQYRLAEEGNPTMNIWLGKQYLNQKEKTETDLNIKEIPQIILKRIEKE